MTMIAAASAIIDDLVDSGSFLRTEVSASDYGILDDCETCAVIVRPGNSSFSWGRFGGRDMSSWGMVAYGFVDGTGEPTEVLGRIWQMHDVLLSAISEGSNANNTLYTTHVTATFHDPMTSWESPGGHDFALVSATISCREL